MTDITVQKININIPNQLLQISKNLLNNYNTKSPIRHGSIVLSETSLSITAGDFVDLFSFTPLNSEEQFTTLRFKQFGIKAIKEKIARTRSNTYRNHLNFCLECLEKPA